MKYATLSESNVSQIKSILSGNVTLSSSYRNFTLNESTGISLYFRIA